MKTLNPKNFPLLPVSDLPEDPPKDGFMQPLAKYCRDNFNEKCIEHYRKCKSGLQTCHAGFTTYMFDAEGRTVIWTGIKVGGHFDKLRIRRRESTAGFKVFSPKEIESLATQNVTFVKGLDGIFDSKVDHAKEFLAMSQKHTANAFHEIRPLNAEVKAAIHKIKGLLGNYKTTIVPKDYELILGQLNMVSASSDIISVRMQQRDLLIAPAAELQARKWINLRREFDNFYNMFRTNLKKDKLSMHLKIPEKLDVKSSDIFKLIPFVLIENAFKYSPINIDQSIEVTLSEQKVYTDLSITSMGPEIAPDEVDKIFLPFCRGAAAEIEEGSGVGLAVAKKASHLLGMDVAVVQEANSNFSFNDRQYFETTFSIRIPKTMLEVR